MAAGINPFALQMQQLQRRQAIADMMQQQSQTPLDTQMVGNVAVRRSPFEGLAKVAQAATSGAIQNSNDSKYQDIVNAMMTGQKGAIAGLAGGQPSAPTSAPTADASPNMPPESIRAPGYTPPPMPPQQPQSPAGSDLASRLDAMQNAAMYGVDPEVLKAAAADQARTEQMKNDAVTGIGASERGNLVRRDSIKQAYVPGSGGMLDIDPNTQQPFFRTLPGMAESSANAAGLSTAATEAQKGHWEENAKYPGTGNFVYPKPPGLSGLQNTPLGGIGRGGAPAAPAGGPPATERPTTVGDVEGMKVGAKTGQDYAAELNARASDAIAGKRTLSEMTNLLQGFEPGKGAPVLAGLGSAAVAMGVSPDTVTQLTNVNPGDAEAFQKGTAALAGEAAKQVTNRVTQTEFKVFLANNPNWMMTSQGIKRVMDFMGKGFDQSIDQQNQFSKWSKTTSPDRWGIDFPAMYNQQQLGRISAGQTNSSPASLTPTRTRKDVEAAATTQGGATPWPQNMTADQARAKYPKGTVFQFPDGSHGSL